MKKFQIIGTRGRLNSLLGRTSTSSCLTRKGTCLWCSVSISAEASGGRGSNVTFSSVGSWILGYQNLQNLPKHHAKNGLQTSIVWLKMLSATKQLSPQIKFLKCVEYLSHNRSLWLFVTTVILMANADWMLSRHACAVTLHSLTQSSHLTFESSSFIALTLQVSKQSPREVKLYWS